LYQVKELAYYLCHFINFKQKVEHKFMNQEQHIMYVSGVVPKQGTCSPIIIDRHLTRLEKSNWKISLAVPEMGIAEEKFPESWQIISLPTRRWWWPPVRTEIPGSLELRLRCWRSECDRVLMGKRPSAILTVLGDFYSLLAVLLSKSWEIPLSVIVHDQVELLVNSEKERRLISHYSSIVLNQASRVWTVSPELGDTYHLKAEKAKVLFPIPSGNIQSFVEWQDKFKDSPVVAYAGSLHPFQISNFLNIASALQKINGTLLLITHPDNPVLIQLLDSYSNVKYQEPFKTNKEVIEFLGKNASCILVSYSFELTQQPWGANSFPSKLVEFSHLGLPVLILAPPNTALSTWAKRHDWLSYLDCMNEEKLLHILQHLKDKDMWKKMAEKARYVCIKEFDPEIIQAQFESELVKI
jgi:glycosyltransferase involved in cell wall biosynthesis